MNIKDDCCTVVVENGVHLIRTPKGELLKGLVFTRVTDYGTSEPATCIVKLIVNLENPECKSDT